MEREKKMLSKLTHTQTEKLFGNVTQLCVPWQAPQQLLLSTNYSRNDNKSMEKYRHQHEKTWEILWYTCVILEGCGWKVFSPLFFVAELPFFLFIIFIMVNKKTHSWKSLTFDKQKKKFFELFVALWYAMRALCRDEIIKKYG